MARLTADEAAERSFASVLDLLPATEAAALFNEKMINVDDEDDKNADDADATEEFPSHRKMARRGAVYDVAARPGVGRPAAHPRQALLWAAELGRAAGRRGGLTRRVEPPDAAVAVLRARVEDGRSRPRCARGLPAGAGARRRLFRFIGGREACEDFFGVPEYVFCAMDSSTVFTTQVVRGRTRRRTRRSRARKPGAALGVWLLSQLGLVERSVRQELRENRLPALSPRADPPHARDRRGDGSARERAGPPRGLGAGLPPPALRRRRGAFPPGWTAALVRDADAAGRRAATARRGPQPGRPGRVALRARLASPSQPVRLAALRGARAAPSGAQDQERAPGRPRPGARTPGSAPRSGQRARAAPWRRPALRGPAPR